MLEWIAETKDTVRLILIAALPLLWTLVRLTPGDADDRFAKKVARVLRMLRILPPGGE